MCVLLLSFRGLLTYIDLTESAKLMCCASSQQYPFLHTETLRVWRAGSLKTGSKDVSVSWGLLGVPGKKYSELSQNFICNLLMRLSLRNAKSTASDYLTIANNELEIMWNTLLFRMIPMMADWKTAPLNTNQKLYRMSHESVSNIDRIHNRITGFVFQYSQP